MQPFQRRAIVMRWSKAFSIPEFSLSARIAQAKEEHQLLALDYVDDPTLQEVDEVANDASCFGDPASPAWSTPRTLEDEGGHAIPNYGATSADIGAESVDSVQPPSTAPPLPTVDDEGGSNTPSAPPTSDFEPTRRRRRKIEENNSNTTPHLAASRSRTQQMLKLKPSNGAGRKPKWVRPPLPPPPERSPSPPPPPPPQRHGQRKHEQRKRKRAAQKAEARQGTATSEVSHQRARHAQAASTIVANFDTDDILAATSSYIGCERVEEEVKQQRLVHSLDDLVGEHSPWKFSIVRVDMNHMSVTRSCRNFAK
ncbi:hypothetical protein EV360DRAFT_90839 [Lentinula raphanica]|nr:hypothetical protein EV360DRAFT_90839 [Lentinula raphanica]